MSAFPAEGMALTHILVVADIGVARDFYRDVLGADIYREYGGTSCVLSFLDAWLLLVTGGGPTPGSHRHHCGRASGRHARRSFAFAGIPGLDGGASPELHHPAR